MSSSLDGGFLFADLLLPVDGEEDEEELATDVLVHLHGHAPMRGLQPHGLDQWLTELELFPEWYCPAVGAQVDLLAYRAAWAEVLAPVANDGLGPVTVLRDYHAENIMLVGGREGVPISDSWISRTRSPAIPPTTSRLCWRMHVATCPPGSSD